jgi:hypothetical protein
MAASTDDRVLIRQIQGVAVLLSSLPADGKARELFTMALDSPAHVLADRVAAPDDPDSDAGMKAWFEGLWTGGDVPDEARQLVEWQADSDNMTAALAELRAVAGRLGAA